VIVALAAGCGDDEDEGSSARGETSLRVGLDADGPGGEPARSRRLSCGSEEATAPACEAVESLSPFATAQRDPDAACTEIYGGPDVASVSGTLEGQALDLRLTRTDGCEISRFDAWVPLLRALFAGYRPGAGLGP
jgi:hypothetical protein